MNSITIKCSSTTLRDASFVSSLHTISDYQLLSLQVSRVYLQLHPLCFSDENEIELYRAHLEKGEEAFAGKVSGGSRGLVSKEIELENELRWLRTLSLARNAL